MKKKDEPSGFTVRLKGKLALKLNDYCDYSGCTKNSLVCILIEEKLRNLKLQKKEIAKNNDKLTGNNGG